MIFNLKLIKNGSQFVCECGHSTFIQYQNPADAVSFACQKCHTSHDAEICGLSGDSING